MTLAHASDITDVWVAYAVEADRAGEQWTPDDGDLPALPDTLDGLHEVLLAAERTARMARQVAAHVEAVIAGRLGDGDQVVLGEELWRVRPERKRTLRPDRATEFYQTVIANGLVRQVFPAYSARQSGLDALATVAFAPLVDEDTGEVIGSRRDAMEAEWFTVEEGPPKPTRLPRSRWPKYAESAQPSKPFQTVGRRIRYDHTKEET